jgi:hypothetical protein
MQDWMNVHGPGGSVKIGGCHAGVSGSTNRTHQFMTTPHTITMCSSVPDSATLTKRFELDSYGFNFTGITTVTGSLNVTGITTVSKLGISTASARTSLHVKGPIHTDRFFQNPTSLDTSITFPESGGAVNGGVFGPYTIDSGVTLTIASGSTFKVL